MRKTWQYFKRYIAEQNCLTSENPVITALKSRHLNHTQGVEVLQQYFYLVSTITQFLTVAMVRIPWTEVKEELRRNLNEELGSGTNGISHQELLETLLGKELGIEVRVPWNEVTKNFISSLLLEFHKRPSNYAAGMIYALEATACPELLVVAEIINLTAQKQVVDLAKLKDPSGQKLNKVETLQGFLAAHTLEFEVGHESGLRTALEYVVNDWDQFEYGFYRVLNLMQIWWEGLAKA